jgi:ubiquitin carboxyl-terminal hydrolase L3
MHVDCMLFCMLSAMERPGVKSVWQLCASPLRVLLTFLSASGSTADNLQQNATSLDLESCALALEADPGLEQAYGEVALDGDTAAPDNPEDEVDYHYICFVKSHKNGHLYQLDGDRKQPIDLGTMEIGDDALSESCLHVIRSMIESEDGNVNFSLMALVPTGV